MQTQPRETTEHRTDRLAASFRELNELNMEAARAAARRIATAEAAGKDIHKPIRDLAAASRTVVAVANVETALFRKQAPPRAPADDTRRAPLRQTLHRAAAATANPAESRREADSAIEETLVADPDGQIPLSDHFIALVDRLRFPIDPATVPDELLGLEPTIEPQPTGSPNTADSDTGDPESR